MKISVTFSGFIWSFGERIFAQTVSAIVGIVLARILLPNEYGVVSIVMVFINICDVFVNSGFGTALVQKKNVTKDDYGTALSISSAISFTLYILLFIAAPFIAEFYDQEIILNIIRVMGVRIIIAAFNNIQQAKCQREMNFRLFFMATSLGTFVSGVLGVLAAYNGFGAWALVVQYLSNSIVDTIVLNIAGHIRIKPCFDIECANHIFKFGSKVLGSSLVYTIDSQIRSMAIGKVFGPGKLAHYDQGNRYPALIVTSINAAMQKVLLPTFSRKQDDIENLKEALRKSVSFSLFCLAPVLLGFFSVSDVFVRIFLTEKWLKAVPYLQIFCLYYLTRPFESSCHQALLAIGRSGIVFKTMLFVDGTGLLLALLAIFVFRNVLLVAVFMLISTLISIVCFSYYSKKYIFYSWKEQIIDVIRPICIAGSMGIIVYFFQYVRLDSTVLQLCLQIITGMVIYAVLSVMFQRDKVNILLQFLKRG